jgi:rhodanese-related sulfurtransferase
MSYKNLAPVEFKAAFENNPYAVVIDVRTPVEIASGKIPAALEIDFFAADFAEKVQKLDKSKVYFMVCRSGNRSGQACAMMSQSGFKELVNLAGGMMAWEVAVR